MELARSLGEAWPGLAVLLVFLIIGYIEIHGFVTYGRVDAVETERAFRRGVRLYAGAAVLLAAKDLAYYAFWKEASYLASALISLAWMAILLVAASPGTGLLTKRGTDGMIHIHTRRMRGFLAVWGVSLLLAMMAAVWALP